MIPCVLSGDLPHSHHFFHQGVILCNLTKTAVHYITAAVSYIGGIYIFICNGGDHKGGAHASKLFMIRSLRNYTGIRRFNGILNELYYIGLITVPYIFNDRIDSKP